jgi:NAD(P)H-hydrate epimerase
MIKRCPVGLLSWISVRQMRDVDRVAIELGLTRTRMMENAGANLAWLASAMLGGQASGRRITVLAGPGGNGGGGLVAARRLIGWGADVAVRPASHPADLAPVPLEQLRLLEQMEAPIAPVAFLGLPDRPAGMTERRLRVNRRQWLAV